VHIFARGYGGGGGGVVVVAPWDFATVK